MVVNRLLSSGFIKHTTIHTIRYLSLLITNLKKFPVTTIFLLVNISLLSKV